MTCPRDSGFDTSCRPQMCDCTSEVRCFASPRNDAMVRATQPPKEPREGDRTMHAKGRESGRRPRTSGGYNIMRYVSAAQIVFLTLLCGVPIARASDGDVIR